MCRERTEIAQAGDGPIDGTPGFIGKEQLLQAEAGQERPKDKDRDNDRKAKARDNAQETVEKEAERITLLMIQAAHEEKAAEDEKGANGVIAEAIAVPEDAGDRIQCL